MRLRNPFFFAATRPRHVPGVGGFAFGVRAWVSGLFSRPIFSISEGELTPPHSRRTLETTMPAGFDGVYKNLLRRPLREGETLLRVLPVVAP